MVTELNLPGLSLGNAVNKTFDYLLPFGKCKVISGGLTLYYNNKELHNLDGPAVVDLGGNIECWYRNDKLHRLDGPAYISTIHKIWYLNGLRHRVDGPAYLMYNNNGKIILTSWMINGIVHRDNNLPCIYDRINNVTLYCKDGYLHRTNGPARITPVDEEYWLDGEQRDISMLEHWIEL